MITTNRRRQFGEVDDKIKIIHPQWWHIKCVADSANLNVVSINSWGSMSVKEVVSAPEGGTITVSSVSIGPCFKVSKPGTYEFYATISHTGNTSVYYMFDCVYYVRLPKPYSSNYVLRPLFNLGPGGGTQHNRFDVYSINPNPPAGPNNDALGALANNNHVYIYVPKGSIENYINNADTKWRTMYDAGRLIEVDYKIIED